MTAPCPFCPFPAPVYVARYVGSRNHSARSPRPVDGAASVSGLRSIQQFAHPIDHIHAKSTNGCIEFTLARKSEPQFEASTHDWPVGDWWSYVCRRPISKSMERLPLLWLTEDGTISKAEVQLVDGGISIESTTGAVRSLESAGVHIEVERWVTTTGGVVRGELRIRGRLHKVWMLGGKADYNVLARHLQKCAQTIWGNDVDVKQWRRCEGRWDAARLVVRAIRSISKRSKSSSRPQASVCITTNRSYPRPGCWAGCKSVHLESNLVKLGIRVANQGEVPADERDPDRSFPFALSLYPLVPVEPPGYTTKRFRRRHVGPQYGRPLPSAHVPRDAWAT